MRECVRERARPLTDELKIQILVSGKNNGTLFPSRASEFVRGFVLLRLVIFVRKRFGQLNLIKKFYAIPDFSHHDFLRLWEGEERGGGERVRGHVLPWGGGDRRERRQSIFPFYFLVITPTNYL